MYLCRDNDRLLVCKFPIGQKLGEFKNQQQALIAMQLQLAEDIKSNLGLIKSLREQQLRVTRAIQNLYVLPDGF